jgi:hypothetical protein
LLNFYESVIQAVLTTEQAFWLFSIGDFPVMVQWFAQGQIFNYLNLFIFEGVSKTLIRIATEGKCHVPVAQLDRASAF